MEVGSIFHSFDEMHEKLKQYEKEHFCTLKNVDSKTVECANRTIRGVHFASKFRYSYVKYACKHYGSYVSKSKGHRIHQKTLKIQCPMFIYIRVSREKDYMFVKKAHYQHNHETNSEVFGRYRYPEKKFFDTIEAEQNQKNLELAALAVKENLPSHDDELDQLPSKKALSSGQKYLRSMNTAKKIASMTAQLGRAKFQKRLKQLQDLYDLWMQGKEVVITPADGEDDIEETKILDSTVVNSSDFTNSTSLSPNGDVSSRTHIDSIRDREFSNSPSRQLSDEADYQYLHDRHDRETDMVNSLQGKRILEVAETIDSNESQKRLRLCVEVVVPTCDVCNSSIAEASSKKGNIETLEDDQFLDDQTIDACLQLLVDGREDVFVLPSLVMTVMENDLRRSLFYTQVLMESKELVLLPIATKKHWLLLIAFVQCRMVMILDSKPSEDRRKKYFDLWKKYMDERSIASGEEITGWELIIKETPKQKKQSSCGIFVLMNAEAILRNKEPEIYTEADVSSFRKRMLQGLSDANRTDEDERNQADDNDWVQCDTCARWLHMKCAGLTIDMTESTQTYKCSFCE